MSFVVVILLLVSSQAASGLHSSNSPIADRRQALAVCIGGLTSCLGPRGIPRAIADDGSTATSIALPSYERRDRRGNSDAVIREDYWYMTGRIPPRNLQEAQLAPDDPQWNAFGSCQTNAEGSATNSCTYVSLRQRIPAYSKYGYIIALGAREYQQLGDFIREQQKGTVDPSWRREALSYLQSSTSSPPPTTDSLLKMILLASGLLTSPNFNGPNRELLVARYYVNEVKFALSEIVDAVQQGDLPRALNAWEFGRDHWNSYFVIVNRQISPKVGDKFQRIV